MIYPAPKPGPTPKRAPKGLHRGGRMRAVSKGSAFPKRRHREFRAFVRAHECLLKGHVTGARLTINDVPCVWGGPKGEQWWHRCYGPVDPAHADDTQARGAPDLGECVPLCRAAHQALDQRLGKERFAAVTGLDLPNIAAGLALKFVERGGAGRPAGTDASA